MPEFEGAIEPFFPRWRLLSRTGVGGTGNRAPYAPSRAGGAFRLPHRPLAASPETSPWRNVGSPFFLNSDPCASVEASVGRRSRQAGFSGVSEPYPPGHAAGRICRGCPRVGAALIETIMGARRFPNSVGRRCRKLRPRAGVLARNGSATYRQCSMPTRKTSGKGCGGMGAIRRGTDERCSAAMVLNGDILVTGVRWGNAVVCIQPKRGCAGSRCDRQVCKILHDPSVPPPINI